MRGGHSRSGPPRDPNALRRDRDRVPVDWRLLPAAGRKGAPPAWPLTRCSTRERDLWAREWKRPQAVAWQANRQELEVALYVRSLAEAEKPHSRVTLRILVHRQMDALGLTVSGLRANRWVIVDDEPAAADKPTRDVAAASSKERLRLIAEQGTQS